MNKVSELRDGILVTGASGTIGSALLERFSNSGRACAAAYRGRLPLAFHGITPLFCDFSTQASIEAVLKGIQSVVHLAWDRSFVGSERHVTLDPHAQVLPGNANILRDLVSAMERLGTPRIVFLSAAGATLDGGEFLAEKHLAEQIILNSKIPEKIIVRSELVFSAKVEPSGFLFALNRLMRLPLISPVPRGNYVLAPVHLDDLARFLEELALNPAAGRGASIVDVEGGERYQLADILKIFGKQQRRGVRICIKGILGASLLPLLDRGKHAQGLPKLKDFLVVSRKPGNYPTGQNGARFLSKAFDFKSLRESLLGPGL